MSKAGSRDGPRLGLARRLCNLPPGRIRRSTLQRPTRNGHASWQAPLLAAELVYFLALNFRLEEGIHATAILTASSSEFQSLCGSTGCGIAGLLLLLSVGKRHFVNAMAAGPSWHRPSTHGRRAHTWLLSSGESVSKWPPGLEPLPEPVEGPKEAESWAEGPGS